MKVLFLNITIILFFNLNSLIYSKDFPVPIVKKEFNQLIKTIDPIDYLKYINKEDIIQY